MKKIYIILFLFFWSIYCSMAQYTGTNIQLPRDYQGSGTYTATGNVNIIPTFNHNANPDGPINLQIKDPLSFEVPTSGTTGGPNGGTGIVGITEGEMSVLPSGAATYAFPINVPPGISGLAPDISLIYNSMGGEGVVGLGWDIGGISAITRTASIKYYDGEAKPIDFTNGQLLLNGQRLILTEDQKEPYTADFKLEFDDLSKIAYFSDGDYFEVKSKSGLIMEYGNSLTSRLALQTSSNEINPLVYYLNKISDRNGNAITFTYNTNVNIGEINIKKIEYADNTILFEFIDKNLDQITKYYYSDEQNLKFSSNTKLLNSIKIKVGGTAIREYKLDYASNKYLQKITEFDAEGKQYNSLKFDWLQKSLPSAFVDLFDEQGGGIATIYGEHHFSYKGDFNGDGKDEILINLEENGYISRLFIIEVQSPAVVHSVTLPNLESIRDIQVKDFNADGKDDLIINYLNNNLVVNWIDIQFSNGNINCVSNLIVNDSKDHPIYGDFNGDGLEDFIYKKSLGNNVFKYNLKIKKIDGSFQDNIELSLPISLDYQQAEFNGDGVTDLFAITDNDGRIYHYDRYTNDFEVDYIGINNSFFVNIGDLNGDGKTDVFFPGPRGECLNILFFASFDKYDFKTINSSIGTYDWFFSPHFKIEDINKDGRVDFICGVDRYGITSQSGTNFSFYNLNDWGIGVVGSDILDEKIITGDFTGNGYTDFLTYFQDLSQGILHLHLAGAHWLCNDVISTITNSIGAKTKIDYKNIATSSDYKITYNPVLPLKTYKPQIPVVSEIKYSNGSGGFYPSMHYQYEDGISHVGKGFLGFKKINIIDNRTNIINSSYYNEDANYNYYFRPVKSENYIIIDDMKYYISKNEFTYNYKTVDNSLNDLITIYYPYLKENIEKEYELDGSLKTITKSIFEYSAQFGNLIKAEIYKGTSLANLYNSFIEIAEHTYYPDDEINWVLGRLATVKVTKNAPGAVDLVRNSKFEYYGNKTEWNGMLKSETIIHPEPAKNIIKEYQYDSFGNILKSTVTAGSETPRINTTFYDSNGKFADYCLNAKGHKIDYYYEPNYGNLITATDPNNLTNSYEYDGFGNLYKTNFPDGNYSVTAMRWAAGHELAPAKAVYYIWQQATGSQPSLEFFDCMQRPLRQVSYGFKGETIFVDFVYDATGRLEKQSEPYLKGATPQYIVYTYDRFQRVKTTTHPGNRVTTYYYEGLTQKIKNPKNQYSTKKYNAVGWLLESIDNANQKITYDYYADGLLKDMYDPSSNKTSIFYDEMRRKNKVIDPDMGTIEYGYNAYGELIWQKENGVITLQSVLYDKLGRITEKRETESTINYTYDTRPNGIGMPATYTYSYRDANGNSVNESRVYSYDALGRLITDAKTIDGNNYNFNYTYNQYNQPLSVTYPTGYELRNEYNAFGNLDRIYDNRNNKIWDAVNVDEKGKIKEILTGNVVRTTYEYNPITGYLTAIKSSKNGLSNNGLQNFAYQWDAIGNLMMRKDANRNLQEDFTYDGLNRLRTVKLNTVLKQETRYDKLGNITYKSDVGSYNYEGPKPHAVTSINGSTALISRLNQNVTYTSFNKVCAISEENRESELSASMIILYGADHQRIKQVITDFEGNTSMRWHITPAFEKEIKNGKTKFIHYVSSPTGTVAHFIMDSEAGESINYILKDHLGSVQSVLDKNGNVLEEYSYDAWGLRRNPNTLEPLANLNAYLTGRGFTGHEHIDLFALVNMNGRIYDPVIGRFMSADPYIQFPDYTQSLNRYSYCMNNPLSYTDPTGYKRKNKFWNFIKSIVPTIINISVSAILTPVVGPMAAGAIAGFVSGFTGSLINGGNIGDALVSGLLSAHSSLMSCGMASFVGEVGKALNGVNPLMKAMGEAVIHGTTQGMSRAMQGGKFEHGFVSGAVGSLVGSTTTNWSGGARIITAAALGGTAEKMAGGKFSNGAVTATYVLMFNHMQHDGGNDPKTRGEIQQETNNMVKEHFGGFKELFNIKKIKVTHRMVDEAGGNFNQLFGNKWVIVVNPKYNQNKQQLFWTILHEFAEVGMQQLGYNGDEAHYGASWLENQQKSNQPSDYNGNNLSTIEIDVNSFGLPSSNPYNP